jgi:cyclopropane fatty-acyl-phospholipid synthase-like methyltransferase
MTNTWDNAEQAREFLTRADRIPYRGDGEMVLVADLAGALPGRILDLGCGDGRLTALLLAEYPGSTALLVDLSDTMLDAARERFDGDDRVSFAQQRLDEPLAVDGPFDAVVSSLAIHHVTDERKQSLYAECAGMLAPGGVFANLEIVTSPTQELHDRWRDEMGARDDPSDQLRDLGSQLQWLDAAGLQNVDCIWKWRSLALMRGERPAA